jgi:hypothetical protein
MAKTKKIKLDLAKAGEQLSKNFLLLSMSEQRTKTSRSLNLASAAVVVAFNPASKTEQKYSIDLLKELVASFGKRVVIEAIEGLIEFEKTLPEDHRSVTKVLTNTVSNVLFSEKSHIPILSDLGINVENISGLVLSDAQRVESAVYYALSSPKRKEKAMEFLRTRSMEEISTTYQRLLDNGGLNAADTMLAFTNLVYEFSNPAPADTKRKKETPAKEEVVEKKPQKPKREAANWQALPVEEIEMRYSLPQIEERGAFPIVNDYHIYRAAAILEIPDDRVPDLEVASRDEILAFTNTFIDHLPGKTDSDKKKLKDAILAFSKGKENYDRVLGSPKLVLDRLTILIHYYGANRTSKMSSGYTNLTQTARFRRLLRNKGIVARGPEELKLVADKLHEMAVEYDFFDRFMSQAARSSSSMETLISRFDRLDQLGLEDLNALLRRGFSKILRSEAEFQDWVTRLSN